MKTDVYYTTKDFSNIFWNMAKWPIILFSLIGVLSITLAITRWDTEDPLILLFAGVGFLCIPLLLYIMHAREVGSLFKQHSPFYLSFSFEKDFLQVTNETGHGQTAWHAFHKLKRHKHFWLLHLNNSVHYVLPLRCFSAETLEFLLERLKEANVSIK